MQVRTSLQPGSTIDVTDQFFKDLDVLLIRTLLKPEKDGLETQPAVAERIDPMLLESVDLIVF